LIQQETLVVPFGNTSVTDTGMKFSSIAVAILASSICISDGNKPQADREEARDMIRMDDITRFNIYVNIP
jgi:hypothetical protein